MHFMTGHGTCGMVVKQGGGNKLYWPVEGVED